MLVSEREMGISDEHDGIIEIKDNYKIGDLFSKIFAIDEPVIEINLTPIDLTVYRSEVSQDI